MKPNFKPLRVLMGESEVLAPLVERQRQLAHLQRTLADALPAGWETQCRVAQLDGSTLVIAVANGAVATNLKTLSSRLVRACAETMRTHQSPDATTSHTTDLSPGKTPDNSPDKARPTKKVNKEQQVTAIRLIVQPDFFSSTGRAIGTPRRDRKRESISDRQLADLAEKLSDSPLKTAIEKVRRTRQPNKKAGTH